MTAAHMAATRVRMSDNSLQPFSPRQVGGLDRLAADADNSCQMQTDVSLPHPRQRGPSQPKRPMNAFMLWAKKARRDMAALHPDLENSEISSILGQEWKQLPAAQREVYVRGSKTLRDEHKKMYPDFDWTGSNKRRRRRNSEKIQQQQQQQHRQQQQQQPYEQLQQQQQQQPQQQQRQNHHHPRQSFEPQQPIFQPEGARDEANGNIPPQEISLSFLLSHGWTLPKCTCKCGAANGVLNPPAAATNVPSSALPDGDVHGTGQTPRDSTGGMHFPSFPIRGGLDDGSTAPRGAYAEMDILSTGGLSRVPPSILPYSSLHNSAARLEISAAEFLSDLKSDASTTTAQQQAAHTSGLDERQFQGGSMNLSSGADNNASEMGRLKMQPEVGMVMGKQLGMDMTMQVGTGTGLCLEQKSLAGSDTCGINILPALPSKQRSTIDVYGNMDLPLIDFTSSGDLFGGIEAWSERTFALFDYTFTAGCLPTKPPSCKNTLGLQQGQGKPSPSPVPDTLPSAT